MAAPIGNTFAKGHGRPRSAKAAVRRLVKAAQEHQRTATALADTLRAGRAPSCPAELIAGLDPTRPDLAEKVAGRMARHARKQIEAMFGHLGVPAAALIGDIEAGAFLAATRARQDADPRAGSAVQLGRDIWADQVASAAIALDRLVGEAEAEN